MAISSQSFTQIVQNSVAAIQGAASQFIDLTVGSVLRAVVDAYSLLALWLQGIALQVASLTRFATSNGPDADSWAADFDFYRLPAVPATGLVTFSRFTSTLAAVIPLGTIVQTADGTQQYTVIANTANSAYNSTLSAYIINAGTFSAAVNVQAVTAGSAGNAIAGYINVLGSAIPGVDTVSNGLAFANGADDELDPAFRARFVVYLAGLAKATVGAVESAIESIQQDIYYSITENQAYAGGADPGYFYVVVDDGSGDPSSGFLSTVYNAIDVVRPIGSSFGVFGPTLVTANVVMTVTVLSGYSHAVIAPLIQAAIASYIDTLEIGGTLSYTRLAQVAYDATPGIAEVATGYTVNGGTIDITATSKQVVRAGTVTIN
jgi:uncharacterized phage protein gp47/JayE